MSDVNYVLYGPVNELGHDQEEKFLQTPTAKLLCDFFRELADGGITGNLAEQIVLIWASQLSIYGLAVTADPVIDVRRTR